MTWDTRGQYYLAQCPVCDWPLEWPTLGNEARRIATAAAQHEPGCPVVPLDPALLQFKTRAQALKLLE